MLLRRRQYQELIEKLDTIIEQLRELNEKLSVQNIDVQKKKKIEQKGRRGRRARELSEEEKAILLDDTLTVREKADRLGVAVGTISNWMKRYGVEG